MIIMIKELDKKIRLKRYLILIIKSVINIIKILSEDGHLFVMLRISIIALTR
jgi:hypothetical protein